MFSIQTNKRREVFVWTQVKRLRNPFPLIKLVGSSFCYLIRTEAGWQWHSFLKGWYWWGSERKRSQGLWRWQVGLLVRPVWPKRELDSTKEGSPCMWSLPAPLLLLVAQFSAMILEFQVTCFNFLSQNFQKLIIYFFLAFSMITMV
jgi:hypothetical protein